MDEDEAGGAGYGGDPSKQFRLEEAISAVMDEGFLGEEDEDFEDLYNDVNVGENFLQSMRKNEDNLGHRNGGAAENQAKVTPPPQPPVTEAGDVGLQDEVAPSRVPGKVEGYQNVGFRGNNNADDVGAGREVGVHVGGSGLRIELEQSSNRGANMEERAVTNSIPNNPQMVKHQPPHSSNTGGLEHVGHVGNINGTGGNAYGGDGGGVGPGGGGGGGGTILFVGDLHWWTTDAELESELCKYGPVKEVKFFDERASGKSKGYCQVEFYDPTAATACKEGMNGHMFNGRPCVVAYASPFTVKRMGEAQVNRNQHQMGQGTVSQPRRAQGDFSSKLAGNGGNVATGGNNHGGVENIGRGFGRGNWGRGNTQGGMGNRGGMGPMRGGRAGGMGIHGFAGNGDGFGQGMSGTPPLMHPQGMMGQGFDPSFGGPMGRMGNYGGFSGAPATPFPGMLPSFGPVGHVGLPGVAPHVNPAFFGRGMPMNGMGMMHNPGFEGPNMGMWADPSMGGWPGEEHGGRAGESSYGEEVVSDHQHGEGSQERGQWPNAMKEKERKSERDWSGSSERRFRDDRGSGYDKDTPGEKDMLERRHRDDRDGGRDRERECEKNRDNSLDRDRGRERHRDDRDRYDDHHKYRSREVDYDDDRDRGRSLRTHGKPRLSHEEHHRSRSRDADYGKRRRLTSD